MQRDDVRIVMLLDRVQERLEADPTAIEPLERLMDLLDQASRHPPEPDHLIIAKLARLARQLHASGHKHTPGPVTECPMCAALHTRISDR